MGRLVVLGVWGELMTGLECSCHSWCRLLFSADVLISQARPDDVALATLPVVPWWAEFSAQDDRDSGGQLRS